MSFWFGSLSLDLAALAAALLCVLYGYFRHSYTYWRKKNVPYLPPSFPFGNAADQVLLRLSPGEMHLNLYKQLKAPGRRYAGYYMTSKPVLMLLDPELVKDVMTRDFDHFHDRSNLANEKNEPLTGHLVALRGKKWRNLRAKLTPTFTSGKMKMMFQTMAACSVELDTIMNEYGESGGAIDIKELLGRFTTDIIGSCAFGIECNSLKDPDCIFRQYGKKIFEPSNWIVLKIMFTNAFPKLFRMLGLRRFPKKYDHFFTKLVKDTVEYRERNKIQRSDFMQLMIQMKNDDAPATDGTDQAGKTLTLNEMTAQAFVFFLAGFETSSTTMTFALFDLALNQDVQDKVRDEVNEMLRRYDGKLTYEGIMELTYMDKVIQESQRLHAPIPQLARICTKDYHVSDSDLLIEKGTMVIIPVFGLQTDPKFHPDPMKYDPERFSAERKANMHPYTFLPFGEGPRNCIGLRFGLMQTKVGMAVVLRNHRLKLNPRTKTPLEFLPNNLIFAVKGDVWLTAEKI